MKIEEKNFEKITKEKLTNININNNTFENNNIEEINTKFAENFTPVKRNKIAILPLLIIIFITILVVLFSIFTVYNFFNTNIISGIFIKGIDVSNMSKSDAKYQLDNYIKNSLPEEIKLKHNDFETTISLSQIDVSFDTKSAANKAYSIGRTGNIFENNLYILGTMFGNTNIEPALHIDKKQLSKNLEDISTRIT
ncbi:MAG: hypothetical protein HFJ40_03825 [Clostridia bacterium]|nr:hypothetical protein [Clostridia bacterium]